MAATIAGRARRRNCSRPAPSLWAPADTIAMTTRPAALEAEQAAPELEQAGPVQRMSGNRGHDPGDLRVLAEWPLILVRKPIPEDVRHRTQINEHADPSQPSPRQQRIGSAMRPEFRAEPPRQEQHERPFEKSMKRIQHREASGDAKQYQSPGRVPKVPPLLRREDVVEEVRRHAADSQRREPKIGLPSAEWDHGGGMGGGHGHGRGPGGGSWCRRFPTWKRSVRRHNA